MNSAEQMTTNDKKNIPPRESLDKTLLSEIKYQITAITELKESLEKIYKSYPIKKFETKKLEIIINNNKQTNYDHVHIADLEGKIKYLHEFYLKETKKNMLDLIGVGKILFNAKSKHYSAYKECLQDAKVDAFKISAQALDVFEKEQTGQ